MRKLNIAQFNRISEILGNISVAWFTVGVISPILTNKKDVDFMLIFIVSLVVSAFFFSFSIKFAKKII